MEPLISRSRPLSADLLVFDALSFIIMSFHSDAHNRWRHCSTPLLMGLLFIYCFHSVPIADHTARRDSFIFIAASAASGSTVPRKYRLLGLYIQAPPATGLAVAGPMKFEGD